MTPRKELFIAVKNAIGAIPEIEFVDLNRKQFTELKQNYGSYYTAALIGVKSVNWEQMVEQKQEGKCTFEVTLYTKDGWMDQHNTTTDIDGGLTDIDLQNKIIEAVLFLQSTTFKPIQLESEAPEDEDSELLSYKLTFSTTIYRTIKPRYQNMTLSTLNPA